MTPRRLRVRAAAAALALSLSAGPAAAACLLNGATYGEGARVGDYVCQNGQWVFSPS